MTSNANSVEQELVRADASFYQGLLLHLINYKSFGVLNFGLIPYLSLFTVESYRYIEATFPAYAKVISIDKSSVIRASRMRIKFFDDTEKRIEGMFALFDWVTKFHNDWYIKQHKGFLAPIKKALQDDLGIFFYDKHIFGSTHTGLLNLGLEINDLPNTSKDISKVLSSQSFAIAEALGSYISQLTSYPEFQATKDSDHFSYNIDAKNMEYMDTKSARYFSSIFNGSSTETLNISLFVFLVNTNFLQKILKNIMSDSSPSFFKMKFITLFHLVSSLEKLQNYYYPQHVLSSESKEFFREILKNKELELIEGCA